MSSTSRFKKLWRQSSTSKSPTPPAEGERKFNEPTVIDDDNVINLSKSGNNDKPTKTVERRSSRTKRGDVKSRSVNLGGLIGLWKGIESLEKDAEKEPSTVKGLHNRQPSLDRKYIKERKVSIEKKTERKISVEKKTERKISVDKKADSAAEKKAAVEKKASLKKEVPPVEQSHSKDKHQAPYKDVESKESYRDARKSQRTSIDSTVTSLISKSYEGKRQPPKPSDLRKKSLKEEQKQNDEIKHTNKEVTPHSDAKKGFQKEDGKPYDLRRRDKSNTTQTEAQIVGSRTRDKTSTSDDTVKPVNKSLQLSDSLSSSTPDLQRNNRPGSLRRGDSIKRASFRRRSKIEGENKNLAEDFDKIFKRLSIGSELSISQADISSILEQVSQNQESGKEKKQASIEKYDIKVECIPPPEKKIIDDKKTNEKSVSNDNTRKLNDKTVLNDNSRKANEKTVLNDSTNTLLRKQTPASPLAKKEVGRTSKTSNFEEGVQKERSTHEKKKTSNSTSLADKNKTSSPKPAINTSVPATDDKRPTAGPSEKVTKKEGTPSATKTATQAKLEEIAARREALRRKYLERSHSENSIALEKKERFRRQGFSEGHGEKGDPTNKSEKLNELLKNKSEKLTCEVASVTTNTLTPDIISPGNNSTETDSGFSAESLLTQISNRPDTLSSSSEDQRVEKKKKKLIRKGVSNSSDTHTPPAIRKNRDVQKILRRLSLNIPPPTPEEIEEEMQGQDLTEQERKKLVYEKRVQSFSKSRKDSTEEENEAQSKKEKFNVTTPAKSKGVKMAECNDPNDLDQMITKANKSVNNNLSALSEQKFKAMKNQALQRSSSLEDQKPEKPVTTREHFTRNGPGRESVTREREQPGKISPKKIITPRGSVNEKRQKAYDPAKEIALIRTKPVSETREKIASGKLDSSSVEKENKKGDKSARKDHMLNRDHPSQQTFKKQSEWLEKLVTEAAKEDEKRMVPKELSKSRDYIPTPRERRNAKHVEKKPEIDKEAIRENIVEEKTNLAERKVWLEQLVRRNSIDYRKNRLNKTMSLCNLSSLNFEDEEPSDPLPRQVSVHEISQSIDIENRGSAYLLPSALRKRRSMGNIEALEQYNTDGRSMENISTLSNERQNSDQVSNNGFNNTEELDPNLKEAIEAIELPNILERMNAFQRNQDNQEQLSTVRGRRIPRKQRPKSYAGEHLSQLVFENGSFRPKDGQLMGVSNENDRLPMMGVKVNGNNETASSIGKALMVNGSSADTNNNNQPTESPREAMQRKRQNRRSLFSNQRILSEIAEMEQREQEMIGERTKALNESERHIANYGRKSAQPIKEYERVGIIEEKGERLKTYPKGLEAFLHENEVRS